MTGYTRKVVKIILYVFIPLGGYCQDFGKINIGDKVPDLQVGNIKGKAIIINFWGKNCGPCIQALPKLDSLQQEFRNDLKVITVSDFSNQEEMMRAIAKNKILNKLKLPILQNDEVLKKLFPFKLISHLVWIDKRGIVKAFTGSEYVNAENIKKLISGEDMNLPVKRDFLEYDYGKPLLSFTQPDVINPSSSYYSTFTTHLEGISLPGGLKVDSLLGCKSITFSNRTIINLVALALEYKTSVSEDRLIFNVRDKTRYIKPNNTPYQEWAKLNTFTYSAKLPIGLDNKEIQYFVQSDLLQWLRIIGVSIKKEVIIKDDNQIPFYTITEKGY